MIQIRKLREYTPKNQEKPVKFDKVLDPELNPQSVIELFANLDHYVEQIPPKERWNCYYTAHPCDTKKRVWQAPQEVLPFDIDGIEVHRLEAYIPVILNTLCVEESETGIVFSGNGLQFIIGLLSPITEEKYFEKNREHYKAVCTKIDRALGESGLPGKADPAVFSTARLLRLPSTENRKAGKPVRNARLLQKHIAPISFDLQDRSGLPKVAEGEQLTPEMLRLYPVDSKSVLEGCEFLKWVKAEPNKISEPQWFASLSILGRLESGRETAHEYSQGYKSYSFGETETKLEQALSSSGPRTCKNINSLWSKCHTCPHFEKVTSPISIRGEDFIATETTGFHDVVPGANGKLIKKPNYEDLRRYFEKNHNYKLMGGSRICYVYNGRYYTELEDAYLENFAQTHFKPHAVTEMVTEFRKLVQRTNLQAVDWFTTSTARKINFQNGVLDIDTMAFGPHSDEYGFRYVLNYGYDPDAACPTFDRFLSEICQGDVELQKILLEFAGYALSNDSCWAQKAIVMTGTGENGKSVWMDVLRELAGKDNYTSQTLDVLRKETNKQLLDGKLFNMAEETPTKSLSESSLFKNLVAGGEEQVRQLYKMPYVMRNRAKLLFACNDLPNSGDTTHGFFRRLIIVPFNALFSHEKGNRDDFMLDKLLAELPGIFNRALFAYHEMKKRRKFTESKTASGALHAYRMDIDMVGRWWNERGLLRLSSDTQAA